MWWENAQSPVNGSNIIIQGRLQYSRKLAPQNISASEVNTKKLNTNGPKYFKLKIKLRELVKDFSSRYKVIAVGVSKVLEICNVHGSNRNFNTWFL